MFWASENLFTIRACQTTIDLDNEIWPKLSAHPGFLKFLSSLLFSATQHPESRRGVRQWSPEGVSRLLGWRLQWGPERGGFKEEEPPLSGSVWIPCRQCELSLFLLPWFLPLRPHRLGCDGQVHPLRDHWHEKRRKFTKEWSPSSIIFSLHRHCCGAERQKLLGS